MWEDTFEEGKREEQGEHVGGKQEKEVRGEEGKKEEEIELAKENRRGGRRGGVIEEGNKEAKERDEEKEGN